MGSKLGLLKRLLHMEFFRPSSEAEMLKVMQERQFRIIADSNHFSETTQAGVNHLSQKLSASSAHVAIEAPPALARQLVRGEKIAPHTYLYGQPIDQSDVAELAARVKLAQAQGVPVHGVDMIAQFEKLAGPRPNAPTNFFSPQGVSQRMDGDRLAAAEIQRVSGNSPITLAYGEGHLGRANSIDAFLPKNQTGIVGVYANRGFMRDSALDDTLFAGSNTEQRSIVEWMDFIKLQDTGEVFMNDALHQQRSNPTQQRIIPITKLKP